MKWSSVLFCSLFFVSVTAAGKETYEAKAHRIHSAVLTIDTHSDTPLNLLHDGFDVGKKQNQAKSGTKVDFLLFLWVRVQELWRGMQM